MESKTTGNSSAHAIHYLTQNRLIEANPGETILSASLRANINHTHVCGGNAQCSSCRVLIEKGIEKCAPRNQKESLVARKLGFDKELRLACQTTLSGDITLSKPELDAVDIEIASMTIAERAENRIGEEKELTILFADIESYTSFTESVPAFDLVHVINRYYYLMGKIIVENNGQIIDYYGDGLLAVFGLDKPKSMEFDAVSAGMLMMQEVESFNDYLHQFLNHRFKIRVGIHKGKTIVGNIGFKDMRKLAVIGDAVNVASRIDNINRELKTNFLVSKSTFEKVATDFPFGRMHEVEIKGKKGKHQLYELGLAQ